MRILVCGGRDFTDKIQLYRTLDFYENSFIISGAARGADSLAIKFAKDRNLPYVEFPADWDKYRKAAGPIRNKQMLVEGKPDLVIAFAGGNGTRDMIKQAKKAKVMTLEVKPRPKCYILVGLPGSGKSYFAQSLELDSIDSDLNGSNSFPHILSTDDIVERICAKFDVNYNYGWAKLIDFATAIYNKQIDHVLSSEKYGVVVFDRTNLTKASRKKIIDRFKKDYEIIVKEFNVDEEIRKERCASRIGKSIPDEVIERMRASYEQFSEDELL